MIYIFAKNTLQSQKAQISKNNHAFLDKYHVGKSRNYSNLESLEKLHRRFGEIKVSERENGRPSGKARIAGSAVSGWAVWE